MAEKPIMSSRRRRRRRRIAPIHQGAASIVSNREVQRPREEECLPRLRYNEDFHSREEKGGGGGGGEEGGFCLKAGWNLSRGKYFLPASKSFLPARGASFMASLEYRENEMGGQRDDTLDKLEQQGWTGWIPPPIGVVPVCVFNNSGGFRKAGWLIPYWLIKIPHFSNLFYNYIRIGFVYSEPIQRSCLKYV